MLRGNSTVREVVDMPRAAPHTVFFKPNLGLKTIFITVLISLLLVPEVCAQQSERQAPKPDRAATSTSSRGAPQLSPTRRVEPTYPPNARAARVGGLVFVEVLADQDGKVIFVKSISGHPLLRDAAVDAAWGWAFRPTQLKGNPGKYYVRGTITFVFRVESPEVEKKEIESINQQIGEIRKEGLANPQSAKAFYRLGTTYGYLGRYKDSTEEAIDAYKRAVTLKPDFAEAYYNLGLNLLCRRQDEEAKEALTRVVKLKPDLAEGHCSLGEALSAFEQLEQSIKSLKRAIDLKPDYMQAHYLLGWRYSALGQHEEAAESFKRAIRINPNWCEARLNLALEYMKVGSRESALDEQKIISATCPRIATYLLKEINQ